MLRNPESVWMISEAYMERVDEEPGLARIGLIIGIAGVCFHLLFLNMNDLADQSSSAALGAIITGAVGVLHFCSRSSNSFAENSRSWSFAVYALAAGAIMSWIEFFSGNKLWGVYTITCYSSSFIIMVGMGIWWTYLWLVKSRPKR